MNSPRSIVVMVGTPLAGQGGMSAVVDAYRAGGLFEQFSVLYIAAVDQGTRWRKLLTAIHALWLFFCTLLGQRVGLVHIHLASGASFWRKSVFAALAYVLRKRVILHVHGGNFLSFYADAPWLGRKWICGVFKLAAAVIVLSPQWIARFSAVMPTRHFVAIENPVPPPASDVGVRADRAGVTLLFLGRLEKDKGVYELLHAFANLVQTHSQARLIMGGVGDLAGLKELAESLHIQENVDFPGWVVGQQKDALLRKTDVFVLPSHIEALPVSMLEAMSYGLPTVICPVGSIPETVQDGKEALFVPVADVVALTAALNRLCASYALRRTMGEVAQQTYAENYSLSSVLPKITALYMQMLSDYKEPGHRK